MSAAALTAAALSDLLGRAAGWGALGRGPEDSNRVALTFDDGPSTRTPELLAILERSNARATFFVMAPACEAHPEFLQTLLDSPHQIEAHGRWHRHALLLPPWQEWAQIRWHPRNGKAGPLLYRPPYGGHSPFTRLLARLTGRQIALWDVEGRDWTDADASTLAAQTLARVHPGSVILLHDGPAVTSQLLELLLCGLEERGLQAVTLAELPMQRIGLWQGLGRVGASYGG
ncbi:polysaccharide deacetylase family protein [Deinococcus arenicola]|uniref:Polysaccharide deacetylase family protein n=1 Tax=Deinococcus arenicola TaxID=2994950 RepID=A0ABU4DPK8_9DEIO|nr:polysaccharide deacetylase family protein [Deinococcus sp. ZS9-10]MDV6374323.1 polysaccharide deacetylase family protein [Deinococcus sp. ZS9-10]